MKQEELNKLRGHFHALLNLQRVFEEEGQRYLTDEQSVRMLADELKHLEQDFPGRLPPFRMEEYFSGKVGPRGTCTSPPIRSYLAVALGKLKVAIEVPESTPVTQAREFPFVKDQKLRNILERDYAETQRAFISRCWKSVIILAGGAIEAISTDLLLQNQSAARAATKAPKKPDITEWDLADLIKVCVELGLVSAGVERLSDPVRQYRNLVHPGNEIRNKLTFGEEEAKIALEVLHMVHRDLSK